MSRGSRLVGALLAVAVLATTAGAGVASAAAPAPKLLKHPYRSIAGHKVPLQRGQLTGRSTWVGPKKQAGVRTAAGATIQINFIGTKWTGPAKAAFQAAASYWESVLFSPVPITVDARFRSLPGNTLGQAGPKRFVENFSDTPAEPFVVDTMYPIALANKLAGVDLQPSEADIDAEFDNQQPWDFSPDSVVPANRISFRTVVMHELGHGLGFLGSMEIVNGKGFWGDFVAPFHPWIYDRFTQRGTGAPMLSINSGTTALANALKSNDVWFLGTATNPRAKLYAPSIYSGGSSYSHLDEKTFKRGTINGLMTPILDFGEGASTAGPIALRMMSDMGWNQPIPTSCKAPQDLNGDGFNDIIAISGTGALTLGRGIGNGRLMKRVTLGTGWSDFKHAVLEDWTGDGCADLVTYSAADNRIWMVPNDVGVGLTTDPGAWVELGTFGGGVSGIAAVGDFDGDLKADLLVRDPANRLWLIVGNGALGTTAINQIQTGVTNWNSYKAFFSPGDWDGDGNTDLMVVAKAKGGTLKLFRGNGAGDLLPGSVNKGINWLFYNKLFGSRDLSGDGFPDLVGRTSTGDLRLERSTPAGGFRSPVTTLSTGWKTFKVID